MIEEDEVSRNIFVTIFWLNLANTFRSSVNPVRGFFDEFREVFEKLSDTIAFVLIRRYVITNSLFELKELLRF